MKRLTRTASLLSLIFLTFLPALAQGPTSLPTPHVVVGNNLQLTIEGKVVKVHDGDTVTVVDQENKKFNIRLQGIDAPELKQTFGADSQRNLAGSVLGRQVTIAWTKVDKYRRTVGTIFLDGKDINIEQVKAGLAWHFKKYEDEQPPADRVTYAAAETLARANKLGLWKDETSMPPGDWRQAVKAKRWGPPPPEGTVIGNSNSKKYHRPECPGYRDMAERNRVFFKTVAEAEATGYKRAGNCPPQDQIVASKPSAPTSAAALPVAAPTEPSTETPVVDSEVESEESETKAEPGPKTQQLPVSPLPREDKPIVQTPPVQPATQPVQPATPPVQPADNSSSDALPVIGNKNSRVYHLPGCASYNRVSEKNQVKFKTAEEAEAAGYKRAGNCSPDKAKSSEQ